MKIGPKFKIAKRLGAPIFEKTQTQKFALSEARTGKTKKRGRATISDYSRQLTEKQKMRYTYGITEGQLERYVTEAVEKGHQPIASLLTRLEMRLDNVVYRLGLAKTRRAARQMVSHGHVQVNGKRLSIASHRVKVGDAISVREGSKASGLYTELAEDHVSSGVPAWLSFNAKGLAGEVKSEASLEPTETMFDPKLVLEYYSR
jgi:small subunit ribosomal protein S4